jgi:hypothetical protein
VPGDLTALILILNEKEKSAIRGQISDIRGIKT